MLSCITWMARKWLSSVFKVKACYITDLGKTIISITRLSGWDKVSTFICIRSDISKQVSPLGGSLGGQTMLCCEEIHHLPLSKTNWLVPPSLVYFVRAQRGPVSCGVSHLLKPWGFATVVVFSDSTVHLSWSPRSGCSQFPEKKTWLWPRSVPQIVCMSPAFLRAESAASLPSQ